MLTRIDHIGIACFDLDRTVEFYRATYGFEVFHSEVNEEQGVREAMLKINSTDDGGASYLQLLEPAREDSAVGKWLAKNGEGVHHIAAAPRTSDGDAEAVRSRTLRTPRPTRPRIGSTRRGRSTCAPTPRTATADSRELVTAAEAAADRSSAEH
ncbi:methylmalonyl-CoA epimerase [Streptomyces tanashiensis]